MTKRWEWPEDPKCYWCGKGAPSLHVIYKGYESFMHLPCFKEREKTDAIINGGVYR